MNLWILHFYSLDVSDVSEMSDMHSATQMCPQHWAANNFLPQTKGNILLLTVTKKSKTTMAMTY